MNNLILSFLLLFILSACAGCTDKKPTPEGTPSFITRQGMLVDGIMESTPFIWHGQLLSMVSAREFGELRIYNGSTLLHSTVSPLALASAIVVNNTLYAFGVSNQKHISMQSTTDLINWTSPQLVLTAPTGHTYFNNSITATPAGYVMALETCEPNTTCFNARFFESNDLVNWTPIGSIMEPYAYAACPTIRFINGQYYIFYLAQFGEYFATVVSRSTDLMTFTKGNLVVVSTRYHEGTEGINASDMDLVEYNGKVYINYADGDQLTWTNIRRATYDGTLDQFVNEFFKSE